MGTFVMEGRYSLVGGKCLTRGGIGWYRATPVTASHELGLVGIEQPWAVTRDRSLWLQSSCGLVGCKSVSLMGHANFLR